MSFLSDVRRALAQIGDARFQRVFITGIGLTLLLLVAFYAAILWLLNWWLPDTLTLPFVGPVGWIDDVLSGASILVLVLLSGFVMVPVASAFTGLFLDDVTDAVEARHYPALPPAPRLSFAQGLRDSIAFLGVLIVANLVALVAYLILPPLAPVIFLALNGYLLGREYFQLVATRRLGREGAARLRQRHALRIWAAGCVMALPLLVPVLGLVVPVLGAASFTHLYHRLPAH
ncbi:hypothetical protein E2L08_14580 [Palleronia sediminis]|uniref:CysZ-like protein n=1 Tax=Palleronia sediminis TaxID=2547833 RepID=A0A4R5ZXY7_9RHOB|nr:EI24 domain-containing protein [Palleronia sediminis]TDL76051.1 hypothetical protein E2L08_14580 [Palleronia sediminis]